MITPQEIEQISFNRATFGGYDMHAVDEFLDPLTEDYITLYKENALLKSKMKVLVSKLEEYRNNEASMKDAIVNAQKTCDKMVKEAEEKCKQMLSDANRAAAENTRNSDELVAVENQRVEEAKKEAITKIDALQEQIRACIDALEEIKTANLPAEKPVTAFDFDREERRTTKPSEADAVADEISANLEALVGTTDEIPPKIEPRHPMSDTTGKFANLRFGPCYDPTNP
jgi:cell division initiation protein